MIPGSHVTVVRTNVVGDYATVYVKGGKMESHPVDNVLLFERFPFGWQALDFLNSTAILAARGLSPVTTRALLRGMPSIALIHDTCSARDHHDTGPIADVASIRRLRSAGNFVPFVVVAGKYALASWGPPGSGTAIFAKRHGTWSMIANGGGDRGNDALKRYGIRESDCGASPIKR